MRFRVRAAAIILNDRNEVLLVFHKNSRTGEEWWTPPGGGLESDENTVDAVIREVREECGIECTPDKLVYVRELLTRQYDVHHIELFFTAKAQEYAVKVGTDPEADEQLIREARFLSRSEIENTNVGVYPEILRNRFWDDLKTGFTGHTVYLGLRDQ